MQYYIKKRQQIVKRLQFKKEKRELSRLLDKKHKKTSSLILVHTFYALYLFQFLGNTHACVHFLSPFSKFGLIVFQKVSSGEFRSHKVCQ